MSTLIVGIPLINPSELHPVLLRAFYTRFAICSRQVIPAPRYSELLGRMAKFHTATR